MDQHKTLPWLDLMRYVAALLVVVGHCRADLFVNFDYLPQTQQTFCMRIIYILTSLGHPSVLIFFVLSGYLVGGGILKKLYAHNFNPTLYIIDRSTRIQLPLLAAILLIFITNEIIGDHVPFANYILNFFSLQCIICKPLVGPLWSLSYEVWFYVIGGAIATIFISKTIVQKIVSYIICVIAMIALSRLNIVYTFLWLMGAIASIISIKYSKYTIYISFCIMCVTAVCHLHAVACMLNIQRESIAANINTFVFGLASCVFIMQIVQKGPYNLLSKFFNNLGSIFAKFSYTLYLTHYSVLLLVKYCGVTKALFWNNVSILIFLYSILIAHIVAFILYLPFEAQSYKLKNLIKKKFI